MKLKGWLTSEQGNGISDRRRHRGEKAFFEFFHWESNWPQTQDQQSQKTEPSQMTHAVTRRESHADLNLHTFLPNKGPFIFYGGGGEAGGIWWVVPLKYNDPSLD